MQRGFLHFLTSLRELSVGIHDLLRNDRSDARLVVILSNLRAFSITGPLKDGDAVDHFSTFLSSMEHLECLSIDGIEGSVRGTCAVFVSPHVSRMDRLRDLTVRIRNVRHVLCDVNFIQLRRLSVESDDFDPQSLRLLSEKLASLVHLSLSMIGGRTTRDHRWDLSCLRKLKRLETLELKLLLRPGPVLEILFPLCNEAFPLDVDGKDTLPAFPTMRLFQISDADKKCSYFLCRTNIGQVKRWITKHEASQVPKEPIDWRNSNGIPAKSAEILPLDMERVEFPLATLKRLFDRR